MKKYYIFLFILFTSFNLNAKGILFIEGFEDIPLFDHMKQSIDNDITFNNEETGYIETNLTAIKKTNFSNFKNFYRLNLQSSSTTTTTSCPRPLK